MRVLTSCMRCQQHFGVPRLATTDFVEVPDNGVLLATCDLGHETAGVLQNEKYQLLAEMAIDAINQENYRDAIVSFVASLERLFEYAAKAIAFRRGMTASTYEAAWKPLSKHSERQLGAFSFLYALERGDPAPKLPTSMVELRNSVVHNGRLATRQDALRFGQAIADCALPILNLLSSEDYELVLKDLSFSLLKARGAAAREAGRIISTVSLALAFEPTAKADPIDLKQLVADRAARPDMRRIAEESKRLAAQFDPKEKP